MLQFHTHDRHIYDAVRRKDLYRLFDGIIPQVKDSKRNGYIEFNGTVNVLTPNGSTLRLACVDDDTVQHQMTIINGSHHIIINEPEGFMSVDGNKQPVHINIRAN